MGRSGKKTIVLLLLCLLSPMHQTLGEDHSRYVTEIQQRPRVTYESRTEMVSRPFTRSSWIPFKQLFGIEQRAVPVVRWVPSTVTETIPVTRQLSPNKSQNPRRTATETSARSGRNLQIGRTPTPIIHPRPIQSKQPRFMGGVQAFDADAPRVGYQLRTLR